MSIKLKQKRIGKYLIEETYGIVYRVFCSRCGRNMEYLQYECPICDRNDKKKEKEVKDGY